MFPVVEIQSALSLIRPLGELAGRVADSHIIERPYALCPIAKVTKNRMIITRKIGKEKFRRILESR